MKLRDYQREAYNAALLALRKGCNPVISLPTGSGKSLVLAALLDKIRRGEGYSLMLTHSEDLIVQNVKTLRKYAGLDGVGVYSAGLGYAEIGEKITAGTIQSLYRNLDKLPYSPDVIFVDEAHLIAPKDSKSKMYNALFRRFPDARRVGLSATPYRLDKGLIYGGESTWFDTLAIEIDVIRLVEEGFLAPLVGVSTEVQLDLKGIHKVAGDYNTKEVEERTTEIWLREVLKAVARLAEGRKRILLFAPSIRVAELAAKIANEIGTSADYVHAGDDERGDRLARWKAGEFRLMANVNILTTGFDLPILDCIVSISPTESLGRWIQMLGRGTRMAVEEGKKDCLILDFAGNLRRLGGISAKMEFLEEKKGELVKGKIEKKEKTSRAVKKEGALGLDDPMASSGTAFVVGVKDVDYIVIGSRTQEGRRMVMCQYDCVTENGLGVRASEFLCVEYEGFARKKAVDWFARRGVGREGVPANAWLAKEECIGLPIPRKLKIRRNNKYFNVVDTYF